MSHLTSEPKSGSKYDSVPPSQQKKSCKSRPLIFATSRCQGAKCGMGWLTTIARRRVIRFRDQQLKSNQRLYFTTLAGEPTATAKSGIDSFTTECAPITAPSPIVKPSGEPSKRAP